MPERLKTARCALASGDTYLLVMHRSWRGKPSGRWGLPGGRIEIGEKPEVAVHRELREELSVRNLTVVTVGDYFYKQARHRVFGAHLDGRLGRIDRRELADVAWVTLTDLQALADDGKLHAGFELDAVARFAELRETL